MTLGMGFATALAAFVHIALRSAQSVNVVTGSSLGPHKGRGYYLAVCPVAFGIAASEVFIVSAIVGEGWSLVLPLGVGATAGCYVSMLIHHKLGKNT